MKLITAAILFGLTSSVMATSGRPQWKRSVGLTSKPREWINAARSAKTTDDRPISISRPNRPPMEHGHDARSPKDSDWSLENNPCSYDKPRSNTKSIRGVKDDNDFPPPTDGCPSQKPTSNKKEARTIESETDDRPITTTRPNLHRPNRYPKVQSNAARDIESLPEDHHDNFGHNVKAQSDLRKEIGERAVHSNTDEHGEIPPFSIVSPNRPGGLEKWEEFSE